MNAYQINGAPLGDGTPDNRVWLSLSTIARVTSASLLVAYRYLAGATIAIASSAFGLNGRFYLTGSTAIKASSSMTLVAHKNNPFGALGTVAKARSTMTLVSWKGLTGATTARVVSTAKLAAKILLSGSTTVRATSAIAIAPRADFATDAWTTRVPYVNNETRVR